MYKTTQNVKLKVEQLAFDIPMTLCIQLKQCSLEENVSSKLKNKSRLMVLRCEGYTASWLVGGCLHGY